MPVLMLKGGAEPLVSATGSLVTNLTVGAGWDIGQGGAKGLMGKFNARKGIDLDLSAIAINSDKQPLAVCGFDTLVPYVGGMVHTGDNRTGKGEGDDESLNINLSQVQWDVQWILVTLTAFKDAGKGFAGTAGAYYRLVSDGQELAKKGIPLDPSTNAALLALLERNQSTGAWTVNPLNIRGRGRVWQDAAQLAAAQGVL